MGKIWLVLTVFGQIAGGQMTPSDMATCQERQAIEEPRSKRLIYALGSWHGWRVEPGDVEVFCIEFREGHEPRIGKRVPKA
jgi:hypothetical protein